MCKLLHTEWRCTHTQVVWTYCNQAPPFNPPSTDSTKPCAEFVHKCGSDRVNPTDGEYRNHCCCFACCEEDQAQLCAEIRALERALRMEEREEMGYLPKFLMNRRQVELKEKRRLGKRLSRRHEERCEAVHYGLGWLTEGSEYRRDARDPALQQGQERPEARASIEVEAIQEEEEAEELEERRGRAAMGLGTVFETKSLRSRSEVDDEEAPRRRKVPEYYRHSR